MNKLGKVKVLHFPSQDFLLTLGLIDVNLDIKNKEINLCIIGEKSVFYKGFEYHFLLCFNHILTEIFEKRNKNGEDIQRGLELL